MSNKHLVWAVVAVSVAALLSSSRSPFGPNDASGQQIIPGGRAAHVHSFHGDGGTALTASAPGAHGFIITDIVAYRGITGTFLQSIEVNGATVARFHFGGNGGGNPAPRSYHFESGIVVPAGAQVGTSNGTGYVTISGYDF